MADKPTTYYEQELNRINETNLSREHHYVQVRQSKAFMERYYSRKIELNKIAVDDLEKEYERLSDLNVEFSVTPKNVGAVMIGDRCS